MFFFHFRYVINKIWRLKVQLRVNRRMCSVNQVEQWNLSTEIQSHSTPIEDNTSPLKSRVWHNIVTLNENLIYKKYEEHCNIVESLINEETTSEARRSLSVSAAPMPDPSSQLKMCINVMTSSWSRVRHWSAPERLQWTEAETSSQPSSSLATGVTFIIKTNALVKQKQLCNIDWDAYCFFHANTKILVYLLNRI
jgi:hypothetical protein